MIRRICEKQVLQPKDVKPSHDEFTVIGVFNPGAIRLGNEVVLLARIAEKPREHQTGFTGLPRLAANGEMVVDWVPDDQLDRTDSRVVRRMDDGLLRLTSISHLRVFRDHDGQSDHLAPGPSFLPESSYEEYGVEDPRITKLGSKYWITYVAVSRFGSGHCTGFDGRFRNI